MKTRGIPALLITLALLFSLAACGTDPYTSSANYGSLTPGQAETELNALAKRLRVSHVDPILDIYSDADAPVHLADIDKAFRIRVQGRADIVIEIAAGTEKAGDGKDGWFVQMAERFNRERHTVGGKTVAVTIREIIAGDGLTYITQADYRPDAYAPANALWGDMLAALGVDIVTVEERTAGNTAGILMEKKTYDQFIEKYKTLTMHNIMEAALAKMFLFAYTNPFTSDTGLNMFTTMLNAFDPEDPLSDKAADTLLEYQRSAPPVAYSTAVMRTQAAKGIVKAMVMECQAYINTPELKNYVFTPAGVRHDNPVYTFDWVNSERQQVLRLFLDLCLSAQGQKAASDCGFNLHNDYKAQPSRLDGAGLLAAQRLWKQSKDGGRTIFTVFVADVSGSMDGTPLNSLKESLLGSMGYIKTNNHVGLVSYSDETTVHLPVAEFGAEQQAYFSGAVKSLKIGGSTATYDAVLVGLQMLLEASKDTPDAKLMLFVLSDGQQNRGYSFDRVKSVVKGLGVPIYSISFNGGSPELAQLSEINEAACMEAESENLINLLAGLFNVQM